MASSAMAANQLSESLSLSLGVIGTHWAKTMIQRGQNGTSFLPKTLGKRSSSILSILGKMVGRYSLNSERTLMQKS